MSSETIKLACQLIEKCSVSPEDAGCQQLLIDRLSQRGFETTRLPFGDVDNFWSTRGARQDEDGNNNAILVFAGHTDVVPTGPENQWQSPPFTPTLTDDGLLRGRGAADMKGSLAAMITACERFIAEYPNHKRRIGFLITSDEEGPAINGTVKVVEWLQQKGETINWCVIGEPTSDKTCGDTIKNGRRGSLGCELTIKGIQGHIAYPQLAENPIHKAVPALTELSTTQWDNGNDFFPATSFQISNINGGTGATNVIPGELNIVFNFRFSTEVTEQELRQRTEAILDKHQLSYDIHWNLSGQPFLTSEGELINASLAAIKQISGIDSELSTSGGTSDGRFIAPMMGAQLVELGPCNDSIHKIDEAIIAEDLDTLSLIYEQILKRLLC